MSSIKSSVKHLIQFSLVVFILILSIPLSSQTNAVYRIVLSDDIISPVSAEYIIRAIDKSESDGAGCLIIELDTPGGLLSSTRTIVKRIMNAKVPVVVYVAPKGARAGSAGVFITLAAHVAAMSPSTNIGAAHPVELEEKRSTSDSFEELLERIFKKEGEKQKKKGAAKKERHARPMEQKVLNDTKAWAAAIARDRGRNVQWAEKAVEESVSVTDTQALKLGVADFVASDTMDLLSKIDGRKVSLPDGVRVIETDNANVIDIPKGLRLRWLSVLAHPNIAYILLMLGFYGLLFEFTHPGVVFPGVAGAICLILAFFGLQVLPTNYAGIALIILAIGMFIAEVKVASFGLLTMGGLIALILGSLILFASPYEFMQVSLPLVLAFALATFAVAAFLGFIVLKSRGRRATTGREGLVGERGSVKSWQGRSGKVFVHGELWDARSNDELALDDEIEVTSVKGMFVTVKKAEARSKKQEA